MKQSKSIHHIKRAGTTLAKPVVKAAAKLPTPKRRKAPEDLMREALANVPKITNDTISEHREDVLAGARKYIYPLKHSRRAAVIISSSIIGAALILFVSYVCLALYKFQSTSSFVYDVTQVLPLPVAKAGNSWVSYNSYLFELRHYMHYYETQQGVDFTTVSGKAQLANYKKQALQQVIDDAYVKQLARKNHVRVTSTQVDNQVALVRSQNRLGTSQHEFDAVLNEFWGWDENDFKRELSAQMLSQAVAAKLDTDTTERATTALQQLQAGTDFATLAGQLSDDATTRANGGQYSGSIDKRNTSLPPQVMQELFKLQAGQISGLINTGYSLEIVRVNAITDGKVQASHIQFNFKPVSTYLQPLEAKSTTHRYIKV